MPVTNAAAVIAYTLVKVNVDMQLGTIWCHFARTINGAQDGGADMTIEGADAVTLFATQATAGQPLNAEITDAIYAYAIAQGVISGVIS